MFVRVVVVVLHDLHGARRLFELYAVQVVYADRGQRLLLMLLLVLDCHRQFGLGPVQRRVCWPDFVRVTGVADDTLQVLRGFDEPNVVDARGRELRRNERCRLLRPGHRRHRRPTAFRRFSCEASEM